MHIVIDEFKNSYRSFFKIYTGKLTLYKTVFFIPAFLTLFISSLCVISLDGVASAFVYAKHEYSRDLSKKENVSKNYDGNLVMMNLGTVLADTWVNLLLVPLHVLKFCFEGACNFLVWIFTFSSQKVYN